MIGDIMKRGINRGNGRRGVRAVGGAEKTPYAALLMDHITTFVQRMMPS